MKKVLASLIASMLIITSLGVVSFAATPNENVYNGNYSGKLSWDVSAGDTQWGQFQSNGIAVEANTDYTISLWSKGYGAACFNVVTPTWSSTFVSQKGIAAGSAWQKTEATFNSGDATTISVVIINNGYGSSTGCVYIDDITIAKTSDPDTNVMGHGDFESESGWGFGSILGREYSEVLMKDGAADPNAGDVEPVANTNVYDGNYSLKITNSTSDNFTYWSGNYMPLEANTDYILSAWCKGSGNPNLRVLKPDWSGNITQMDLWGSDWTHVSLQFNSGDYTQGVICFANNPWGSSGTMYVDNISVVKASDTTATNLVSNPGFETGDTWGYNNMFAREYSAVSMVEGQEPPAPTFTFTDAEGNAAEKLVLANGVKVTTDVEGVLIIAAYADDRMITVKSGEGELSFTAAEMDGAEEVRAFVVDGIKTLIPLVDAESIYAE